MSKFKVVITDYYYANQDQENSVWARLGDDIEIIDLTKIVPGGIKNPDQIIPYLKDCDAVIIQFAKITKEVIDAMEHCKVIARYAIGVDVIDVDAATAKGIYVANVPDYCIDEVANTAASHLLNAMRKVTYSRDLLLENTFDINKLGPVKRIKNATLCLIGFGNIARDLCRKMTPFFRHIVAYDPYFAKREDFPEVEFIDDVKKAVSKADAISIHVPLNDATKGMINSEVIDACKDNVIIVNTARGPLIDDEALERALKSGKIAYAGLDVIATEDFVESEYLRMPTVCLTPHIGWNSVEAGLELQRKVAENVVSTLTTGKPIYSVNSIEIL